MILFSTQKSNYLAQKITAHHGACTIKQFSDGEIFVRIDQDVRNKKVWVVANTQPPAENMLELFFLLDALERAGAHVYLFITYFAYARQVIAKPGEAVSAEVIGNFFKNFNLKKIIILHAHSKLLHDFLNFTTVRDLEFFCTQAHQYDAIAAPDKGAYALAQEVAETCKKELILLTKTRPDHEKVEIVSVEGTVTNKKILIVDDIIATGKTLIEVARALHTMGAKTIAAAATHGIFTGDAQDILAKSIIEKIAVTNSVPQHKHEKIVVHDISHFISKVMREE